MFLLPALERALSSFLCSVLLLAAFLKHQLNCKKLFQRLRQRQRDRTSRMRVLRVNYQSAVQRECQRRHWRQRGQGGAARCPASCSCLCCCPGKRHPSALITPGFKPSEVNGKARERNWFTLWSANLKRFSSCCSTTSASSRSLKWRCSWNQPARIIHSVQGRVTRKYAQNLVIY